MDICIYLLIYSTYVYVARMLLAHCLSVAHLLLAYCSPKLHELELGQSVATEKLSLEVRKDLKDLLPKECARSHSRLRWVLFLQRFNNVNTDNLTQTTTRTHARI